mmetsp:Transcript_64076/g.134714  ORF Transcript_64076/g.134714 Transcript_64076/m.134714 type:complete len:461 (-) Transcript_64076:418-1800(-)
MAGILEAAVVTSVPALAMALGSSAIIISGEPSEQTEARLQHFSGGLLIGAVVTDIFPILKSKLIAPSPFDDNHEVQWQNLFAGTLGFIAALALMHGVKSLGLEDIELDNGPEDLSIEDRLKVAPLAQPTQADSKNQLAKTGGSSLEEPLLAAEQGEKRGLKMAVARLIAQAGCLGELARAEDVDREAVDEEVHHMDFLIDVALRRCQSEAAEPCDAHCSTRLRAHVMELNEHVAACRAIDPKDVPSLDNRLQLVAASLRQLHAAAEQKTAFRRWAPRPPMASDGGLNSPRASSDASRADLGKVADLATIPTMPWGLVLAVLIDSIVDGMLIGLAASVALESGWLMAMATAIEMGFLGYSYACSVAEAASRRGGLLLKVCSLGLPPIAMICAASLAAAGAADVKDKPAFVGLMAFALAALLFLVVEELLLEAHEKEGSEEWHISVWLYFGLLLSICLDVSA